MSKKEREVIIIHGDNSQNVENKKFRQARVASYSRVSTDMEEQLNSFYAQKEYYTEMIMRKPEWTLAGTFADCGLSGATAEKRPEFMKMIRQCKKGKIDLIITKSISRFARNTLDSIGYVRQLKAMGVGVLFEKESINTLEENSEVVLTILSGLAQEELNSLSKNVKMGKRMAMQEGKVYYNYSRFYGYEKGEDGQPKIVSEQAVIIKRIYSMYLAGESYKSISEVLNSENIPTSQNGKRWTHESVKSILKNERMCGDVILQKTFVTDPISKKTKKNNGELPKIYIKNNHDGIVSREEFDNVQAEIARRNNKKKVSKNAITENGKYSSKYALSEILICGHCGTPYRRVTWTKRDGTKQPVWRCINRIDYGTQYCAESVTVDEESIHKAIMEAILSSYTTSKVIPISLASELKNAMRKKINSTLDIGQLENKISELTKETMEIFKESLNAKDEFQRSSYESKMKSLSDEAKKLKDMVDDYKAKNVTGDNIDKKLESIQEHIQGDLAGIMEYDDSLVRQIIHTIRVIDESRLRLYFKNGLEVEQKVELQVRKLK